MSLYKSNGANQLKYNLLDKPEIIFPFFEQLDWMKYHKKGLNGFEFFDFHFVNRYKCHYYMGNDSHIQLVYEIRCLDCPKLQISYEFLDPCIDFNAY